MRGAGKHPPSGVPHDRPTTIQLLVVDKWADNDSATGWVDVEDHLGVVGEELIRTVRRRDDEDIMGAGLHEVGDPTQARAFLVDNLQADELVEKVLARLQRAGISPCDAKGSTPESHSLLWARNPFETEQGLASVEPDTKEAPRLRFVADVDALQRGEVLRVIREQAQLDLAIKPMYADQRPYREANMLHWSGRIGTRSVHETLPAGWTKHALRPGFRMTPLRAGASRCVPCWAVT